MAIPPAPPKTVVLGAGASRCAGGPLLADFRMAAEETLENAPFPPEARRKFERTLRWWKQRHPQLDIEALTVLLENEATLEAIRLNVPPSRSLPEYFKSHIFSSARSVREGLRYLIAKTIATRIAASSDSHDMLIEKLLKTGKGGIITLNWDSLVEEAASRKGVQLDLGHDPSHPTSPLLAKLHGSLDWWNCSECQSVQRIPLSETLPWWEQEAKAGFCPCGGELWPLFVPPVASKLSSAREAKTIANVWQSAQWQLFRCEHLIFVGYSFPAGDLETRMFFREAFSYDLPPPRITIVSPDPAGLLPRYHSVFGGIVPLHHYTLYEGGFEDWIQQL